MASNCLLTKTDDLVVFNSKPGRLTLALTPTVGNVTFMLKDTDVLDASGKSINPTKALNSLSFDIKQGQTYTVEVEYFIFPTNSQGVLKESCAGDGVIVSTVSAATNPQQFTVKG